MKEIVAATCLLGKSNIPQGFLRTTFGEICDKIVRYNLIAVRVTICTTLTLRSKQHIEIIHMKYVMSELISGGLH